MRTATILVLLGAAAACAPARAHDHVFHNANGVTISAYLVGTTQVQINYTYTGNAWMAFGISTGSSSLMTGGGAGSDIVYCSSGQVMRNWVTAKTSSAVTTGASAVSGATCTQSASGSSMSFTRNLAASGNQRAITEGATHTYIWAHGNAGATAIAYHSTNKGGGTAVIVGHGDGSGSNSGARLGSSSAAVCFVVLAGIIMTALGMN